MARIHLFYIITPMAKILFLGTGASIPTDTRDNTSILFYYKGESFLVDCPGSIIQKLQKMDINYLKIKHIIVTHHHPDHVYGIPHFIHTQMYLKKEIKVFSTPPAMKVIKELLKTFGLQRRQFPKVRFVNVLRRKYFFKNKELKIKAIPNKHTKGSFGIKFIWKKNSLLYSSDTAISKSIVEEARKSTYLIHDCTASSSFFKKHPSLYKMHTDALSLAKITYPLPLKKVIPIHFLFLKKSEEGKVKKELHRIKDKLIIPCDFQTIYLK